MKKILAVVGTRPEAIKMAPLINALRGAAGVDVITLCSGQHTDMVTAALEWFGIAADDQLNLPTENRSLAALTGALFPAMEQALRRHGPDVVLAQGDTTTVMVASVACFYKQIPFGHVEAGLRTRNLRAPFPEELNRRITGLLATWHFCPTATSKQNLVQEGVDENAIYVTGNTGIDALAYTAEHCRRKKNGTDQIRVLVTTHRRENHGNGLIRILRAVKRVRDEFPVSVFILPVHPNPAVRAIVEKELDHEPRIHLTPPMDYPQLVEAMIGSRFVLTDSGGIQEEAPYLRKPVLVLRDVTERPEAVSLGVAKLLGTDEEAIVRSCRELLTDGESYKRMALGGSPYGDGYASPRICHILGLSKLPPNVSAFFGDVPSSTVA